MPSHAQLRAVERYGQNFRPEKLLAKIQAGEAKLVAFSHSGRLVYDVPAVDINQQAVVVRVVVPAEKNGIITIVPPQTPGQIEHARRKPIRDAVKKNRRTYFKDFEDDEEVVAAD
jgi:hypothetical protein